jgi:hypothetical protein
MMTKIILEKYQDKYSLREGVGLINSYLSYVVNI